MTRIFILGSGGLANELAAYWTISYPSSVIIFVDDFNSGNNIISVETYHDMIEQERNGAYSIMGSGKCDIKLKMDIEIRDPIATYIHPTAVTVNSKLGKGCVLAPQSVVSLSELDKHVLVNYGATVGHNCVIGDLSVIGPNAAIGGNCEIGTAAYIGSGATVKEGLYVGNNSIVGMGTTITSDLLDNHIAIGTPAMIFTKEEWPEVAPKLSQYIKLHADDIRKMS